MHAAAPHLLVLAVAALAALTACTGDADKERFDDEGGSGAGAMGPGGSPSSVGGATASTGGGAAGGGSPTTDVVCFGGSLTVGDLTLDGGDAEFDGNGPLVQTTVELGTTPQSVIVTACVDMTETVSDFTSGSRCVDGVVEVANAGLVSTPTFAAEYTDTDHDPDNVLSEATTIQNDDALVDTLQCVGDTDGDDICSAMDGSCSMCIFSFGCVEILLPQP